MKEHKRYNIGILIGGVHTYFPKEHILGIAEAAEELDVNVCFFLGTQTKDFFEDMLGGTHKNSFDYQFNTIHDYSPIVSRTVVPTNSVRVQCVLILFTSIMKKLLSVLIFILNHQEQIFDINITYYVLVCKKEHR